MKRILWVFLFTFLISACYAQQTGQLMRGQSPSGKYPFISVDENGKLNTTSTISSVPISITTQFVATDSANRLQVNIASCAGNIPVVATIPETVTVSIDGTPTVSASIDAQTLASLTVHVDNFPSTQTVALAPPITFTQTSLKATNTATPYTTSAGCEAVSLFSLGSTTIWFSLDGAGATVSAGIPLTATNTMQQQQSFGCGPNKKIYYIASNTTAFTILESGR